MLTHFTPFSACSTQRRPTWLYHIAKAEATMRFRKRAAHFASSWRCVRLFWVAPLQVLQAADRREFWMRAMARVSLTRTVRCSLTKCSHLDQAAEMAAFCGATGGIRES